MKILIGSLFALFILSFISCQKNADVQIPDNPASDSGTLVISRLYQEFYDEPGLFVDSATTKFFYDKSANSLTASSYYGIDDYTWTFTYDNNGNWTKDITSESGISTTKQFTRNANGDPTRFDYDYYGTNYTAFFQYETLPGNIKRTTVVDTQYIDYPRLAYYKADQDADGKLIRMEFLPWSHSNYSDHRVLHFYYNADNQISYLLDSTLIDLSQDGEIRKVEFTQDPGADNILDDFSKNLKGKNFWWFTHDKEYYLNYFYDYDYVGKALNQIKEYFSSYTAGSPQEPFTLVSTTTVQNRYDADNHLTEMVINKDGEIFGRYKFWYEKIK